MRNTAKVIRLHSTPKRPLTFTSNEQFIERVRELLLTSGVSYESIANDCGLSKTTVNRLAIGHTKWPRPTTLFPILGRIGYEIVIQEIKTH